MQFKRASNANDQQDPEKANDQNLKNDQNKDKDQIENNTEELMFKEFSLDEEILRVLDHNPVSSEGIKFDLPVKVKLVWKKLMDEGFPTEEQIKLLKNYSRSDDHFTEAAKVNLEIVPAISEIAIKRDQHFIETKSCVGSTLVSLVTVMGMPLSDPEGGVDRLKLIEHIGDAGRLFLRYFTNSPPVENRLSRQYCVNHLNQY